MNYLILDQWFPTFFDLGTLLVCCRDHKRNLKNNSADTIHKRPMTT